MSARAPRFPGAHASLCPTVEPPLTSSYACQDEDVNQLHSRVPFVKTSDLASATRNPSQKLEVVALDCELVYSTSGMALARLTVVGHDGAVVLDEHVRPQGALLDTNIDRKSVV